MLFNQIAEPVHPGVGLGENPVRADSIHEQVARDAKLGRDYPLRALFGGDLYSMLHQLTIVFDVVGDGRKM
jgi:hypothetical protein